MYTLLLNWIYFASSKRYAMQTCDLYGMLLSIKQFLNWLRQVETIL